MSELPLAVTRVAGVAVDGCQGCGGVWFDRGELTRLAQGDLTQLAAIDRAFEGASESETAFVESSPCPMCGTGLAPFQPPQTPQLSLTGCPAGHGTWLREEDCERIIAQVEQWRARQRGTPEGTPTPARRRLRDVAHLLLSQPCPNCRQPNAAASPVCWACGTVLQSSLISSARVPTWPSPATDRVRAPQSPARAPHSPASGLVSQRLH